MDTAMNITFINISLSERRADTYARIARVRNYIACPVPLGIEMYRLPSLPDAIVVVGTGGYSRELFFRERRKKGSGDDGGNGESRRGKKKLSRTRTYLSKKKKENNIERITIIFSTSRRVATGDANTRCKF